mmetsp:Transcript_14520/g.20497  ORF Transcript_14520/g.20497 Transcript_14520/m.20497 type:complete len:356 (+) Transcript_14520:39-1106(+)
MQVMKVTLFALGLVSNGCQGFSGITKGSISNSNVVSKRSGSKETKMTATTTTEPTTVPTTTQDVNNNDDYPWSFTGRLWFRPALVKLDQDQQLKPPSSVSMLNLFGWTVGGVVALEYDDSPVGPYREYVTMGAVVSKRGCIGQWGSSLYVSNDEAERICQEIWNVPAQVANIEFVEGGQSNKLNVVNAPKFIPENNANDIELSSTTNGAAAESSKSSSNPFEFLQSALFGNNENKKTSTSSKQTITVNGWKNTRTLQDDEYSTTNRCPRLPILWTPTIKALWAPFVPLPPSTTTIIGDADDDNQSLPLHRLRLSASAIRLHLCGQESSEDLGIPLPIGLSVDNVLIEIGPKFDTL